MHTHRQADSKCLQFSVVKVFLLSLFSIRESFRGREKEDYKQLNGCEVLTGRRWEKVKSCHKEMTVRGGEEKLEVSDAEALRSEAKK